MPWTMKSEIYANLVYLIFAQVTYPTFALVIYRLYSDENEHFEWKSLKAREQAAI